MTSKLKKLLFVFFIMFSLFICAAISYAAPTSNNIFLGANVKASSEASSIYSASKLVDGDSVNTRWNALRDTGTKQWVELSLNSNYTLNKIVIKEFLDRTVLYTLEGYDGTSWKYIFFLDNIESTPTGQLRTLKLTKIVVVKKIRINFHSTKLDSNG